MKVIFDLLNLFYLIVKAFLMSYSGQKMFLNIPCFSDVVCCADNQLVRPAQNWMFQLDDIPLSPRVQELQEYF